VSLVDNQDAQQCRIYLIIIQDAANTDHHSPACPLLLTLKFIFLRHVN